MPITQRLVFPYIVQVRGAERSVRMLLAVEIGQDRFDPAGDAEFAIDIVQVSLYGIDRNAQLISNILVPTP
jgi:hypothetical protein